MSASFLAEPIIVAVLNIILKATLLVAVATGLTGVLRSRNASASSLHLIWTLAITALLVLPLLGIALPGWRVEIPSVPTFTQPAPPGVEATISQTGTFVGHHPAAHESASRLGVIEAAMALYLLGVIVCLFRILVSNWRVAGIVRRSIRAEDHAWLALMRDVAPMTGVRRPVRLVYSAEAQIPMTWGSYRPVILLPKEAHAWSSERRRAVLLHELAHVVRLDCLIQWLTTVVCALYWIHPAVWYAAGRLRRERERACDDHVINAGLPARVYATELFDVARAYDRNRLATVAALAMAEPSELEERLLALMDGVRSRTVPSRRGILATFLGAAAVTIPLACLQPRADRVASVYPVRTASPIGAALPAAASTPPLVLSAAARQRAELRGHNITATANPTIPAVVASDSSCDDPNITWFEFQVDRKAEFIFDSTVTAAPSTERRSGGAAIQFVVDRRGLVEPGSFKVLRSTNDGDVARVREAFPQWRFRPAMRRGCVVRQLVQVDVHVAAPYQAIP